MNSIFGELQLKGPNRSGILKLARQVPGLPPDYLAFLTEHDGAEGPVGSDGYLVIWSADQIIRLNEGYEIEKYAPGFLFFGSDGGAEGYAFDFQSCPPIIVGLPLLGIDRALARPIAGTFTEFLNAMNQI